MNAVLKPVAIPEGYWPDPKGRLVPIATISAVDQLRDEVVRQLVTDALDLQTRIAAAKSQMFAAVETFCDLAAAEYETVIGGEKGNISLTSFDGLMQVRVQTQDRVTFDERLQAAKSLVDECLNGWSADAGPELRTLVMQAFQVDKEGRIATGRILGLLRLDIRDERWRRAMDAIRDSILVLDTARYLRIYRRDAGGKWEPVVLDFSAL